ncbi:hypothetical protein GCM10027413_00650 [Conyzicola nivalis]|uniref:Glycosyltransferase n=1 Tax=Conyzicola nivalis TaxID=1477021 RepID=A0A916SP44_9MICO|nr:exopolysaccharide biosynthesis GT4 family glycosyltransferase EpsE [Conyzicola nivalis]GGB10177.1 hypothetical protein GCM10010979_25990 [Conyzicola nivalis]
MNAADRQGARFGTADQHNEVTVVIVTFNSLGRIDPLLASLRGELGDQSMRVIVADNGSDDDIVGYLGTNHPDVVALPTGGNLGYAAAINIALRELGPTRAVLVLNPDTVVQRASVSRLLATLDTPGCGAVVPRLNNEDGTLYTSLRREPTLLTAIGDALLGARLRARPGRLSETVFDAGSYARPHDIDWATGAALMIDIAVVRRVGPWDERYFLYSEETDYCRRIRKAGFTVRYEPAAVVVHEQGASGASPRLNALSAVNRVRYARKFHSRAYAAAFRAVAVVAEVLRVNRPENALALRYVLAESTWGRLPRAHPRRAPSFGYLVPEFPGQTHAFFWREIVELRRQGALPHVVSTRLPPPSITSHEWSAEAIRATTYLGRPTVRAVAGAARALVAALLRGRLGAVRRELAKPPESPAQRVAILIGGALLTATARRQGWSHVHVHSCAGSARIALIARLLGGPTYSLTLHGSLPDYGSHQPAKWSNASFALIITKDLLGSAHETLGDAMPAAVSIAPMGVDPESLQRDSGYSPWDGHGEARVFSCGRLNPAKGHDTLIRAVAALGAEGLPVRLVIAGEDEEGGTGYRATLERLIDELGLRARVELLGAVDEGAVRAQLERAHVFALASHAEPLGVAIMEAMAMAAPVVIGDGGGVRELVDDGNSGLLVDPESVAAVASGIRRVLTDGELAQRLGRTGRERVRAEFGSAKSAGVLLRNVQSL